MPEHRRTEEKLRIGWVEYINIPDWHIKDLKTKIDTGARTSALHVEDLKVLPGNRIRFHVILCRKNRNRRVEVTADISKQAKVRSSNGHYSKRYFVKTPVRIGPVTREIEISLVARDDMLFRMLLGRKAVEKDFLVDPGKRLILSGKKKTKQRKAENK
jgi:hypothetical protein